MSKALVVLSGGQDSTTCLFWAIEKYGRDNVSALTFDYAQRHRREIEAASMVARLAGIERHEIAVIGAILAGRSPLTDREEHLEQYDDFDSMSEIIGNGVEKTFVPMRNALFLTLAANRAFCADIDNIVTGVCQEDNANYPDCRQGFIELQAQTINVALGFGQYVLSLDRGIRIQTPLINSSKKDTVNMALDIFGAYGALAYSHTAYDGQYPPKGHDHATTLRAEGFRQAGHPDPLVLRAMAEGLMGMPTSGNYSLEKVKAAAKVIGEDLSLVTGIKPWWKELASEPWDSL